MPDQTPTVDYQARQDIAVLQADQAAIRETLTGIKDILNHILTAIIVFMVGAAGASFWNWVFVTHAK